MAAVNEQRRRIHAVANVPAIATAFERKDIGCIHPDLPADPTIPISAATERGEEGFRQQRWRAFRCIGFLGDNCLELLGDFVIAAP